jgi:hypothetical protein
MKTPSLAIIYSREFDSSQAVSEHDLSKSGDEDQFLDERLKDSATY